MPTDLIGSVIARRPAVSATAAAEKEKQGFPKTIFSICQYIPNIDILDANTSEMSRDPNKNVINCLELKTQDQSCVPLWRRGRPHNFYVNFM